MTKQQWKVCAGDPTWVEVPDLVRPVNCFSAARARLIVDAVNAYLQQGEPTAKRCCCGTHEWEPDAVQIEDSRGVLHYADRPCHHK
jgi:hypothetical protein